MGMFLFRYPKDDITCWFIRTIEVPAFLFILAFLAFDIAAFRHGGNVHVNYIAHFSGFVAGALYKLAFWKIFTTENPPEPKKRPVLGPSARARATAAPVVSQGIVTDAPAIPGNLRAMQMPGANVLPFLIMIPLIAWRMYSRVKRNIGRQTLSKRRPWITIAFFRC